MLIFNLNYSKPTVVIFGKSLVEVWVNFGRYLVLGNQAVAFSHFWGVFGVFPTFLKQVFRGLKC